MRGKSTKQVERLWNMSGIDGIGTSKHMEKQDARIDGARTSHAIAQETAAFSYSVKNNYLPEWVAAFEHAREHSGIRDICTLKNEHIEAYLRDKGEAGPKWSTFTSEVSAVMKLSAALNRWNETQGKPERYDFGPAGDKVRNEFRKELDRTTAARIYDDPKALIERIQKPEHQLAASLQRDGKFRIMEATLIKPAQLRGTRIDAKTGQEMGYIFVKGKGGANGEQPVVLATYRATEAYIAEHGQFQVTNHDAYRADIKQAAAASGQAYGASHGLRYNGACERMIALRDAGVGYAAALQTVSYELLHERISITLHYCKSISPW